MKALDGRNLRWLAPLFFLIFLLFTLIGFTLQGLTGSSYGQMGLSVQIPFYILMGLWLGIGALIVWYHPRNPVGWMLAILAPVVALDQITFGYVAYDAIKTTRRLPGVEAALVWLKWTGMPFGILIITLELLVFPNGRFLSKRWRPVAWVALGAVPIYLLLKAFEPSPITVFPVAVSPLAVSASLWSIL